MLNSFRFLKLSLLIIIFTTLYSDDVTDTQLIQENIQTSTQALMSENYDDAIAALERALIYNPDSKEIKEKLDETYKLQNELNRPKHQFSAAIIAGALYDTNTTNIGENIQKDFAHQEIALINYSYLMSENLHFKNTLLGYYKNFFSLSDQDIIFGSYTPSLTYKDNNLSIDLGLYIDDTKYGANYNLYTFGIAPNIKLYLFNIISLFGNGKYLIKKDALSTNLDSKYYEITAGANLNLVGRLTTSLFYSNDDSDYNIDYITKYILKASVTYITQNTTTLTSTAKNIIK